jgi:hypothetical protein
MGRVLNHDKLIPNSMIPVLAAGNYIESNTEPEDKFMVYGYYGAFVVNTSNRYVLKFVHTHPLFFYDPYFNNQYKELLYNERPKYLFVDQEPPSDILNYITEHYRIVREEATFQLYEFIAINDEA